MADRVLDRVSRLEEYFSRESHVLPLLDCRLPSLIFSEIDKIGLYGEDLLDDRRDRYGRGLVYKQLQRPIDIDILVTQILAGRTFLTVPTIENLTDASFSYDRAARVAHFLKFLNVARKCDESALQLHEALNDYKSVEFVRRKLENIKDEIASNKSYTPPIPVSNEEVETALRRQFSDRKLIEAPGYQDIPVMLSRFFGKKMIAG